MAHPSQSIVSDDPSLGKPPRRPIVRDDVAYVLPIALFIAFTWAGGNWPSFYPLSYIAKTLIVPVFLWLFWPNYTRIRWTHWRLGVIFGVLGVIQWVGMEKLLLLLWPGYPRISVDLFNPTSYFDSTAKMWGFILLRWAGATLVVPVMEELFWRDFLWRTILAPNDFKLAEVGERNWQPILIVALLFSTVHVQWMTAIVWGLMVAWLLVRTRSLGACIIMHAVTNFLLGGYVLFCHFILHKDEWYFW